MKLCIISAILASLMVIVITAPTEESRTIQLAEGYDAQDEVDDDLPLPPFICDEYACTAFCIIMAKPDGSCKNNACHCHN